MKLANGYGSITKMSGNRRNKWRVRLPYSEEDRINNVKRKSLGYFATKTEALQALAEYHNDPELFMNKETTFSDVYTMWSVPKFKSIAYSNQKGYEVAFKECLSIHNMPINDIKLHHLQEIIDKCPGHFRKKQNVKTLMNQVFNYAVLNDLCKKSYVKGVVVGEKEIVHIKSVFTEEEINKLWENVDDVLIQYILILIYTGMRISELFEMPKENVFENYMIGGNKTKAGKNRIIPIHKRIIPLIKDFNNNHSDKLILRSVTVSGIATRISDKVEKILGTRRTPHEARHTFITRMREADVPLIVAQKIAGHKSTNVTERVYTHIVIKELVDAVNKMP